MRCLLRLQEVQGLCWARRALLRGAVRPEAELHLHDGPLSPPISLTRVLSDPIFSQMLHGQAVAPLTQVTCTTNLPARVTAGPLAGCLMVLSGRGEEHRSPQVGCGDWVPLSAQRSDFQTGLRKPSEFLGCLHLGPERRGLGMG